MIVRADQYFTLVAYLFLGIVYLSEGQIQITLLENTITRLLLLALIIYLADQDIRLAVLVAAGYLILRSYVFRNKIIEGLTNEDKIQQIRDILEKEDELPEISSEEGLPEELEGEEAGESVIARGRRVGPPDLDREKETNEEDLEVDQGRRVGPPEEPLSRKKEKKEKKERVFPGVPVA